MERRISLHISGFNVEKIPVPPKLHYRFNVIPIKISVGNFENIKKLIVNCIGSTKKLD